MVSIESHVKAAEAAYHDGKFAEAGAAYSMVTQLDPKHVSALERLGSIALWNNHPDKAVGYLKEALTYTSGLQKFWPFNAQLNTRLAMAYYRADQFLESSRFFKAAAGPIALGPFRQLAALGNWLAIFDTEQLYTIAGPNETRIEFVVTDPLPVVQLSIGNCRPVHFLIDTGGSEVILDTQIAKEAAAEVAATMTGEFSGSKKSTMGLGRVDSLRLGEFIVETVPVHMVDLTSLSPLFGGLEIKGIIGTRLLMHFLSTIDYRNGALLLRRATQENQKRLEAQAEAHQAKRIPFWLIDTHYMVAWGTVNHVGPLLFWVDTGLAGSGFIPSGSVVRKAGITVDWSKAEMGVGMGGMAKEAPIVLDHLTLGTGPDEIVEHNVPGIVQERLAVLGDQLGFEISGLISHQFFRNYSLTFDFENMLMILQ
jgi:predicted aspartyl protease